MTKKQIEKILKIKIPVDTRTNEHRWKKYELENYINGYKAPYANYLINQWQKGEKK